MGTQREDILPEHTLASWKSNICETKSNDLPNVSPQREMLAGSEARESLGGKGRLGLTSVVSGLLKYWVARSHVEANMKYRSTLTERRISIGGRVS